MRLIDADALTENSEAVKSFCELFKNCRMKHTSSCLASNCENCFARFFKHYQHLMPTIDAEPVKHGKWVYYGRDSDYCKFYRCSICKCEVPNYSGGIIFKYKFCPYCGAKMDEN